jgi:hypothetical protein
MAFPSSSLAFWMAVATAILAILFALKLARQRDRIRIAFTPLSSRHRR